MTETTDRLPDEVYRARAGAMVNMLTGAPYRHDQKDWFGIRPENECGTTACVAGWATLAAKGIVGIADDGAMTWDPSSLGRVDAGEEWTPLKFREAKEVPTLWRWSFNEEAHSTGREWFGLGADAAWILFRETARHAISYPEQVAVEILRRLADGRLPLNFSSKELNVFDLDDEIDCARSREVNV